MKTVMLAIVVGMCLLSQTVSAQTVRTIANKGWFGCSTAQGFNTVWSYVTAQDEQALTKAFLDGEMWGTLTRFMIGEKVYVLSYSGSLVKVRRVGDTDEWWISFKALK